MTEAEIFHVVDNVTLDFESEGHKYNMKLLIENGLIILADEKGKEKFIFLGDESNYRGEPLEETPPEIKEEPKKKRRSKKKK